MPYALALDHLVSKKNNIYFGYTALTFCLGMWSGHQPSGLHAKIV